VLITSGQYYAGDAESHAKLSAELPDELEQKTIRRQVALVGNLATDGSVLEFVEIARRLVEDRIVSQPEGLMHLKVETHR